MIAAHVQYTLHTLKKKIYFSFIYPVPVERHTTESSTPNPVSSTQNLVVPAPLPEAAVLNSPEADQGSLPMDYTTPQPEPEPTQDGQLFQKCVIKVCILLSFLLSFLLSLPLWCVFSHVKIVSPMILFLIGCKACQRNIQICQHQAYNQVTVLYLGSVLVKL